MTTNLMCRPYFHDNVIDLAFPSSLSFVSFVFPFLPLAVAGSGCLQCADACLSSYILGSSEFNDSVTTSRLSLPDIRSLQWYERDISPMGLQT
jgi:hypothetical protein